MRVLVFVSGVYIRRSLGVHIRVPYFFGNNYILLG